MNSYCSIGYLGDKHARLEGERQRHAENGRHDERRAGKDKGTGIEYPLTPVDRYGIRGANDSTR